MTAGEYCLSHFIISLFSLFSADYSEEQAKVWRVANFVIGQRHAAAEAVFEAVTEFECPEDVTGAVKTTCATTKNVLTVAAFIIKELLRIVSHAPYFCCC
jgi:hypothetical protein